MKINKLILLIAVAVVALSHRSDGQPARPLGEQLRLASAMPRGAMVYVQSRDLSALMKTWLASSVRTQFYASASFKAFSSSRIYLKFQDRRKDFESAIGIGLDEGKLAELAGGASAISIYDIGKLELVFVTEVARPQAVATALFKRVPQFQERASDGNVYYVRDVTTDGGRLSQQFCFAYAGGRLVVTTTEGLMIRALRNAKQAGADSLASDVLATAEQARGFSAHEITLWLDQARLNANRHFNSYWIHRNVSEADGADSLAGIESGLIDLRITAEGLSEQRWFKLAPRPAGGSEARAEAGVVSGEQADAFLRFAPADAQLVEVRSPDKDLPSAVEQALFGKLPDESSAEPEIPDRTHSTSGNDESTTRVERYSRLDARFDIDVDDEQAPRKDAPQSPGAKSQAVADTRPAPFALAPALAAISPAGYAEIVRSRLDGTKPFVKFERAVVIEMRAGAAADRAQLERAITDEMRARFVVAGVEPGLAWQDEGGVRSVAQSLLERGAAYAISGKYLVLASSKELARDIAQAAGAARPAAGVDGPVEFYALVRVAEAKPVFDRLMSKLDGRTEADASGSGDDEGDQGVKFFSENISSFIAASSIREMRVRRARQVGMISERVVYSW